MRLIEQPHHDGSALYVSDSAPGLGDVVTVWVRVSAAAGVDAVHVRSTPDGEPYFAAAEVDAGRTGTAVAGYGAGDVWWRAALTVRNPVTNYRFHLRTSSGDTYWLTAGGVVGHEVPDDTDFRAVAYDAPPAWSADAVLYQIFPDRFARAADAKPLAALDLPDWALPREWDRDEVIGQGPGTSEQFFGGDLDGIAEHLDHLQALGANTVYLTPVFPARSNHRYDASTFDEVDPLLGGDAALARLAEAVHARGMRLIGDITSNHCGDAHEWFTRAASDVDALERDMFYFDAETGGYEAWCGVTTLPKLNWASPLVRERMTAVLRRWLAYFDGWRVDVANMTGRRGAQDDAHEVAALIRRALPADAMLVGEHMHDATGDLDRDGWHGAMNYLGFTRPVWAWLRGEAPGVPNFFGTPGDVPSRDGVAAYATMRAFAARVSWRSLVHSWNILDSHDSARVRTVTGSAARQVVALGLQVTLPGTPMVYAGSEFGLTGWNGENARTPMPWSRPADRDEQTLAVYRELLGLRATEPALRHGGLRWLYVTSDTMVYLREFEHNALLVAASRAAGEEVSLALGARATGVFAATDLEPDGTGRLTLPVDGPALRVWRLEPPR
ncbi:glycoside hydrolase family 13 protein [Catellatospora methionotrophica]|uniref:glycoside hydrolase family 13 protein n=1 Tax=Catellatospora methionotrophica TaxID=121620 RepID=UPI0033D9A045